MIKRIVKILEIIVVALGALLLVLVLLFPSREPKQGLVLSAYREAAIGGIFLGLYDDNSFELGNVSGSYTEKGFYIIKGDTLLLLAGKATKLRKEYNQLSFLIQENVLIEIPNTGINFLEIDKNKLRK